MISDLVAFTLVGAVLTVTPGLDTLLILQSALAGTKKQAAFTSLGIVAGLFVWAALASAGVAAIISASTQLFAAFSVLGAGYLLFLAFGMWRNHTPTAAATDLSTTTGLLSSFNKGFVTNLLNPKIGVFYIALLPNYLTDGVTPIWNGLALGLIHATESLLWFAFLILLANSASSWLTNPTATSRMNKVFAFIIAGFALSLLKNLSL